MSPGDVLFDLGFPVLPRRLSPQVDVTLAQGAGLRDSLTSIITTGLDARIGQVGAGVMELQGQPLNAMDRTMRGAAKVIDRLSGIIGNDLDNRLIGQAAVAAQLPVALPPLLPYNPLSSPLRLPGLPPPGQPPAPPATAAPAPPAGPLVTCPPQGRWSGQCPTYWVGWDVVSGLPPNGPLGVQNCEVLGPFTLGPPNFYVCAAPFADYATAAAWLSANEGVCRACATGVTPPPPPTPPPTPPPPPPPPVDFVLLCEPDGTPLIVPANAPVQAGARQVYGPASYASCQDYLTGHPDVCAPTPPPDHKPAEQCAVVQLCPKPPAPDPQQCDLPPGFATGLPPPGSEQWRVAWPAIRLFLIKVGEGVMGIVDAEWTGALPHIFGLSAPAGESWLQGTLAAASGVLGWLVRNSNDSQNGWIHEIKRQITCWRGVIDKTKICDSHVFIALAAVKTVLRMLSKLRIGSDAGLWATLDIEVDLGPLERIVDYALHLECPTEVPGIADALECYLAGTVSPDTLAMWMGMAGANIDTWFPVVNARRERPKGEELISLVNRGVLTPQQFRQRLRETGFTDTQDLLLYEEFRKEMPAPADLVRFAVRHVFEPDIITQLGYDDELRPAFVEWHSKLGFFYDARTEQEIAAGRAPYTWAQAQWWSHWVLPSPGQGYEMFFRLSPTRDKTNEPPWMQAINFTFDDLKLLLRANDYPPFWRDKLAAIAYTPVSIRFIRQLVLQGVWGKAQVVDQLQRQGYTPRNADDLAESVLRQVEWSRTGDQRKEAFKILEVGYELGTIADGDYLTQAGALGISAGAAQRGLLLVRAKVAAKRVRQLVQSVRARVLSGVLSTDAGTGLLLAAGVSSQRVQEYAGQWALTLAGPRKQRSANELTRDATAGLISPAVYALRLQNLGYPPADILLFVGELEVSLEQRRARLLIQQERQAAQTERAALQALRRQAQVRVSAQRAVLRYVSAQKLERWLREGLITDDEVRARLEAAGWPIEDVEKLIAEAHLVKPTKPPKPPKPPRPPRLPALPRPREPSLAVMKKWLQAGRVSVDEVRADLGDLHYEPADIDRYIAEWTGG